MKKRAASPQLDLLLQAYFGEDYELAGDTIHEIVNCYKADSSIEDIRALRAEIADLMRAHPQDLDTTFLAAYRNDFNPPLWNHTTASFLTEVDRLLSNPGSAPPPP